MSPAAKRLLWFVGLYLASLALFAAATFLIRSLGRA
jgi:hypothetical protein